MKDGLLDGKRSVYYQNGNLSYYTTYSAGIETGESKGKMMGFGKNGIPLES